MKEPNKTEHAKKILLQSLEKSLGVVTTACKTAGVGRTTYYDWYNSDEEFKLKVDDIKNMAIDFAESQLYKLIGDGNVQATLFLLRTIGKDRGYTEQQNITISKGVEQASWFDDESN